MRQKSQATATVQEFAALVQNQFKRKIEIFHTDGERSLGNDFMNWIASEGIILETSAPYTPAQNGTAERSGGVIINRAQEM